MTLSQNLSRKEHIEQIRLQGPPPYVAYVWHTFPYTQAVRLFSVKLIMGTLFSMVYLCPWWNSFKGSKKWLQVLWLTNSAGYLMCYNSNGCQFSSAQNSQLPNSLGIISEQFWSAKVPPNEGLRSNTNARGGHQEAPLCAPHATLKTLFVHTWAKKI